MMYPRWVTVAVLLGALASGLGGATVAAFSSQTQSAANFTAAASFGAKFEQLLGTASCGGDTSTVTVPAGGVPAGSTVLVSIGLRGTVAGGLTVTDSRGNSYSNDVDVTNANVRAVVLSSRLATALSAGDTITASHPFGSSSEGMAAAEFSGVVAGTRVDATATGIGDGASPTASVTTSHANDLLVGAVANQNSRDYTEASSWETLAYVTPGCGGAPGNSTLHTAYRIVSATGAYDYSPTISQGERWAESLAAYKG